MPKGGAAPLEKSLYRPPGRPTLCARVATAREPRRDGRQRKMAEENVRVGPLAKLSEDEAKVLTQCSRPRTFKVDEVILEQGQLNASLFVVIDNPARVISLTIWLTEAWELPTDAARSVVDRPSLWCDSR